jgi:hypothetical protein
MEIIRKNFGQYAHNLPKLNLDCKIGLAVYMSGDECEFVRCVGSALVKFSSHFEKSAGVADVMRAQ